MPSHHGIVGWVIKLNVLRQVVAGPTFETQDQVGANLSKTCTVFTHMNKSGGTTIKALLRAYGRSKGLSFGVYGDREHTLGPEEAKEFLLQEYDLIVGGYSEALRSFPASNPDWAVAGCTWFTMFRQ